MNGLLGLSLVATIGVVLLAFGWIPMLRKNIPSKFAGMLVPLGLVLVVVAGFSGGFSGLELGALAIGDGGASDSDDGVNPFRAGVGATAYWDFFDKMSPTMAEVEPLLTVIDSDGAILINDAKANDTTTELGEELTIYHTGATYYGEPQTVKITSEAPRFRLEDSAVATLTNLAVVIKEDGVTLNAGHNDSDYTYDMGASAEKVLTMNIENAGADAQYRLGAICVGKFNSSVVSDVQIISSGWKKDLLPSEVDDTALSVEMETASIVPTYEACYSPASEIVLNEWEEVDVKFKIETGSTAPTNNSNIVVLQTIDSGYTLNYLNEMQHGYYYNQESAENTTGVGAVETLTSPQGGTEGAVINLY